MVVDDEVGAAVCLAQRTREGEDVAALVLRALLLLLLVEAGLAATVKALQQLGPVVQGQRLTAPAAFLRDVVLLIVDLLIVNLESEGNDKSDMRMHRD